MGLQIHSGEDAPSDYSSNLTDSSLEAEIDELEVGTHKWDINNLGGPITG